MKTSKILVVSPHPDDETLGAGGTLIKFKKQGHKIFWLNVTNMSEAYGYPRVDVERRAAEMRKVKELYSFDGFFDLGLKPCFVAEQSRADLVDKVKKVLARVRPEVIIFPFKNDPHSDHRAVFEIVYSCTKVFRAPFVKKILMMEILSETEFSSSDSGFVPNYFVDITSSLEKKIHIVRNYKGELQTHPFPRSLDGVRALAAVRGAAAGCNYAEAFMLIKAIH